MTKDPGLAARVAKLEKRASLAESALENIIWKLNRNEMVGDNCQPAKIDRDDVVIREAQKAIEKAKGA